MYDSVRPGQPRLDRAPEKASKRLHRTRREAIGWAAGALALSVSVPVDALDTSDSPAKGRLYVPRYAPALATDGKTIIVTGGASIGAFRAEGHYHSSLLGLIEALNPVSLELKFRANALFPRANHAALWCEGKLWLLGGRTHHGAESRLVTETEQIDLDTQAIWRGPDLPIPLIHLCAASAEGSLYVFGGNTPIRGQRPTKVTAQAFRCSPPYRTWEPCAPMPKAIGNCTATRVDGKIYLIGGYDGKEARAIVQVYDPKEDRWETGPAPPYPLSAHGAEAADGRIFVFGDYQKRSSVLAFDVQGGGTWRTVDLAFSPRRHVRAIRAQGRIAVVGGNRSSLAPALDVIETYSLAQLARAATSRS